MGGGEGGGGGGGFDRGLPDVSRQYCAPTPVKRRKPLSWSECPGHLKLVEAVTFVTGLAVQLWPRAWDLNWKQGVRVGWIAISVSIAIGAGRKAIEMHLEEFPRD